MGIAEPLARAIAPLVLATAHGEAHASCGEADLVVDIDLAILGRDPLRFMEFDYAVEEELHAIPTPAFRRGRAQFLARLLDEPIYRTAAFRERFEGRARANVTTLLRSPRYAEHADR
jgi:predicted metal-dependent HD superfamily phosphohydrolase